MRLATTSIPGYSACLAALLPVLVVLTKTSLLVHVFNYVILAIAVIGLLRSPEHALKAHMSTYALFAPVVIYCLTAFLLYRIHPLSSVTAVVLLAAAYFGFLNSHSIAPRELFRQLRFIYFFHVSVIALELLVIYSGNGEMLQSLMGDSYRILYADVMRAMGINEFFGPNSLLLGPQSAGHLVMAAFLLVYLSSGKQLPAPRPVLLAILMLVFLLSINNTSLVILALLLLAILLFRSRRSLIAFVFMQPVLWMTAYTFREEIAQLLFYKFYYISGDFDPEMLRDYLTIFSSPIEAIREFSPARLLLGFGKSDEDANISDGDFGLGMLVVAHGLPLVALLLAWVSFIWIKGLMYVRKFEKSADPTRAEWASLLFVSIILSAAWVLSSAHYLVALKPGGMHLFAFSLAIAMTAMARLRIPRTKRVPPMARTLPEAA